MVDDVYEIICSNPGIDTPNACLKVFNHDLDGPVLTGHDLANRLSKEHCKDWQSVCDAVDCLLNEGAIVFTDSGKLYQIGYQGEVS